MSPFRRALTNELAHLRRDRWDLALLTLMPATLLTLMAAMLLQAVPRNLPIVVVDQDRSSFSRALVRDVAASPTVHITEIGDSIDAAFRTVRQERAWAVLSIPRGAGDLVRMPVPAIQIFYQASFLSTGSVVASAVEAAARAAVARQTTELLASHGLPGLRVPTPTVQATILYNAATSFEWYLLVLICPAVLHLLIGCMTVVALGREVRGGSFTAWTRASGGVAGALAGKMLPYVVIVSGWGAAWLIWLCVVRGWRVEGSLGVIVGAQALLFAATAAISAFLVALTKQVSTGLSASAIYAGSALAYSGATLPLNGGSLFARIWSQALPLTHYMALQMDQFLGAPIATALPQLGALSLYVLLLGSVAVLVLRRAGRT